jgi:hypothetical protein
MMFTNTKYGNVCHGGMRAFVDGLDSTATTPLDFVPL